MSHLASSWKLIHSFLNSFFFHANKTYKLNFLLALFFSKRHYIYIYIYKERLEWIILSVIIILPQITFVSVKNKTKNVTIQTSQIIKKLNFSQNKTNQNITKNINKIKSMNLKEVYNNEQIQVNKKAIFTTESFFCFYLNPCQ